MSTDDLIAGTYLHGLFDQEEVTRAILNWVNPNHQIKKFIDIATHREKQLERLSSVCEQHLNMDKVMEIMQSEGVNFE